MKALGHWGGLHSTLTIPPPNFLPATPHTKPHYNCCPSYSKTQKPKPPLILISTAICIVSVYLSNTVLWKVRYFQSWCFQSSNTLQTVSRLLCNRKSRANDLLLHRAPEMVLVDTVEHRGSCSHIRAVQKCREETPKRDGRLPSTARGSWDARCRDQCSGSMEATPNVGVLSLIPGHTQMQDSGVPSLCFHRTKHGSAVYQEMAWGKTTAWVTGSS